VAPKGMDVMYWNLLLCALFAFSIFLFQANNPVLKQNLSRKYCCSI